MFAVYADSLSADDPLSGLVIGDRPDPDVPDGWARVQVKSAALNHHDVWSLRGVGLGSDALPMILGCDAAGVDEDGNDVIVYAVITDGTSPDETTDPRRTLLSEKFQGTFADTVVVPKRNLVPKPASLSWAEAACLPTSWLTAYRMLATRSGLQPGNTVLVQGAGGGVATACIVLGRAMGFRVWVTSRDGAKRERAVELGAHAAFENGARLPERVDAVMETVGAATWDHTLKSLRPGGVVVISGATSGAMPPADLNRVFFLQLSVVGSTMGTLAEFKQLVSLCDTSDVRPVIDSQLAMSDARVGFEQMMNGDVFGKIVLNR